LYDVFNPNSAANYTSLLLQQPQTRNRILQQLMDVGFRVSTFFIMGLTLALQESHYGLYRVSLSI